LIKFTPFVTLSYPSAPDLKTTLTGFLILFLSVKISYTQKKFFSSKTEIKKVQILSGGWSSGSGENIKGKGEEG
jgi:hypothetical protein